MTAAAALAAGAETATPALEVTRLSKRFGTVDVLRDVTLRIAPGEVVALVGENGAGKSVLVACLARILDADGGEVRMHGRPMPATADQVRAAGLEVVWQDHGHCDDLDVVANIYLGQEPSRFLSESRLQQGARAVMRRVGGDSLSLDRPMRLLSRGQRQLVAVGRALRTEPRVLLLDEPTASLGVAETLRIQGLIRECRSAGAGLLLVTHDLEQVFTLADRVIVLREGRIVADAAARSVSRDDVVSLMSGIGMDSTARRELHRLRSLVDQLSDVEPAASLPLIVSAMATALDQDMVCVHLLEEADDGTPVLRRTAAVGLPRPLLEITDLLPLGVKGGGAGLAAAEGHAVEIDDLSTYPAPHHRAAAAASEIRSEWAAPIVGARGVLGTVSGFATSVGRPEPAQLELAGLYLGYAASAIERERLLAEVSRRNRVLESLRSMLESLAGPGGVDGGLGASLLVLSRAIGADAVAVFVADPAVGLRLHATNEHGGDGVGGENEGESDADGDIDPAVVRRLQAGAARVIAHDDDRPAQLIEPDLATVALRHPEGRAVLVAHLAGDRSPGVDTLELLDDATRSLAPALEAEVLERSRREAAALRRSQAIQRELLSSLSHELRTPLTAIQGYASTLRQRDLTWDAASTERFLGSIATEAARLERLVGDLLDSSAIESGMLQLQRDWCDLRLVVQAAINVVCRKATGSEVELRADPAIEATWGDHDRLEQVFVNLVENAVAHGASDEPVIVTLRRGATAGTVEVEVRDHGPGIPPELGERIFESRVRGTTEAPGAGLGLPIARAIVEAHGGRLWAMPVEGGASFVVALPADPPAETAPPATTDGVPEGSWSVVDETGERHVV
jgi:signal transduction histidine kinase/ABC-type cobalamin/Fe3+-siderophores transport system ATPase subunit